MVCIAVILYSNDLPDCNDFIDLIFYLSGHSALIYSAYPCKISGGTPTGLIIEFDYA